uniref:Uncharacterized protein n=1 Tax=Periphykon beckeri TaxID=2006982 RepID=A0A1Z1M359_9FLOR|nr:hypothetical protein [Periphykon beckeri]ARW60320.1 hypothetical protein [Periphykon beckeri]
MSNKIKIKYWPNQPSINLNNAVVNLLIETEKKLILTTKNKSYQYLYLDMLNTMNRIKLLTSILNQLKELILDIVEINLNYKTMISLNKKIETIFINRVSQEFLSRLKFKQTVHKHQFPNNHKNLSNYLLTYLIFGSSYIESNIFLFDKLYTPYNHVKILLENFIIQTGNIIIKQIIYNLNNSSDINKFLKQQDLCNKLYISNRSVVLFINNLKWQDLINSYIYDIKSLYNERQKICIISSSGIITKYIHLSKKTQIQNLNQMKIIFIFWLEIKDFFIPKTEKFLMQIGKYLLYCSINLFSNLILILIRIIVFYLNK